MWDTQMITINLAERWKNKLRRERNGRPFALYEVTKIFGSCPHHQIGMISQQSWGFTHVNTGNRNKETSWCPSEVHQGALIRLVLWAAHFHAEFRVRCSHLLLCAPMSAGHTELPLQEHVSQQALSKMPTAVNRALLSLCLSGGQKYNRHKLVF